VESFSPQANRLSVHAILASNFHFRLAGGQSQNDPAAECHLLGVPNAANQRPN